MYRRRINWEHSHQVALFKWAQLMSHKYPVLRLMFAIPNESYGGGLQAIRRGKYFRAEGRKSGVPDIFLPVPRGGYHGLFVEMKFGKNKPTENQRWWIENLRDQGYMVKVCYSFAEAKEVILEYLGYPKD